MPPSAALIIYTQDREQFLFGARPRRGKVGSICIKSIASPVAVPTPTSG